jgi:hypothetical protein
MLYLFQMALLVYMLPKFSERDDVRTVLRSVASFVPGGLFVYALSPLVNTALYLVNSTRQHPSTNTREVNPYHRKGESNSRDWHWGETLLKHNAIGTPVLEPGDIDDLLDDGVSVRKMTSPIITIVLWAYGGQCVQVVK